MQDSMLACPTPEQLAWQDLELGLFYTFDINVFDDGTENDWPRQGHLDPNLYNPARLSTDQWMEAAKAMGARYSVFVAKHCTGFLSWQSDLYPYGVKQTKWRNGQGDVLRDYMDSCHRHHIQPGVYCSAGYNAHCHVVNVWNGDNTKEVFNTDDQRAAYVDLVERMVTELWGNYGPLTYIWFDGGVAPPEKGGPNLVPILKRLQPHAVTFKGPSDNPAGNTRWPGNEKGMTTFDSWCTVERANDSGSGNPNGAVWQPAECDAPLRNHDWFWHPNSEGKLYGLNALIEMYYQSVGRGCNLILNANIDRDGLVPEADMRRLREFGAEIRRRFARSLARISGRGNVVELAFTQPTPVDHVIIMEQLSEGQRIRRFVIEGLIDEQWRELSHAQSVGHKRIERFAPVKVPKIRLRVTEAVAEPVVRELAAYYVAKSF